jgi:uncharacterized protein YhbP (UPF0306 family)
MLDNFNVYDNTLNFMTSMMYFFDTQTPNLDIMNEKLDRHTQTTASRMSFL